MRRTIWEAVLIMALMVSTAAVASAHSHAGLRDTTDDVADTPVEMEALHDQHNQPGGHLPGSSENVELIGRADIQGAAPARVADVAAFGTYAYLTVRDPVNCVGENAAGVAIFDISDPTNPVQVGFIDATPGSQPGEGAQVIDLDTEFFSGHVLVFNNELCALGGEGGVSLWDVTDPLNPEVLTAHAGDEDPAFLSQFNQIHSAFAWQDDQGRAFVVMTDNEEDADVDILEITDPRNPVLIAEVNANDFGVLQEEGTPRGANSFLHDMVVEKVRGTWTMLLSYWDGGWVLLDVDDPANPEFIADFDYPDPDTLTGVSPAEGNAHQAEFSPNGRFIIGTDEDFAPFRAVPTITTGPFAGEEFVAVPAGGIPQVTPDAPLIGPTRFVGLACDASEPVPGAEPGEIALIERGGCTFQEKTDNIIAAGYVGGIVFNTADPAVPTGCEVLVNMLIEQSTVPMLFVARSTGFRLLGIEGYDPGRCPEEEADNPAVPAVGTPGESVDIQSIFDAWGYVRLLDTRTMTEIDAYAIDEALDPAFASGFGTLSVHEVAVDPWKKDLAYLSYYAGGLRVIEYGKEGITEVGHFIDEEGNDFWGVEVHRLPQGTPGVGKETLILASDRDSGLWIFRYTGK